MINQPQPNIRWSFWIALFVFMVLGAVILLRSTARPAPVQAVSEVDGTPGYMPIIKRPFPTATPPPTETPGPTETPAPVPSSLAIDIYACCLPNTNAITGITNAGDDRLFVLEREGVIRIIKSPGNVQSVPFLDIKHLVTDNYWEEGLVGIVFHPDYSSNGYFYITFTLEGTESLVLYRYQVSSSDPDIADPESGVQLMRINKPSEVHHAGDLHFGPDGYLYIAVGDGGPDPAVATSIPGDPNNHGQRLDEALGNILRIDVDSSGGTAPDTCTNGTGYTVPAGNPFVDGPGGTCDEVWNYGFRNPWRFSFDMLNGDMYIGDVGEWAREEINYAPAGTGAGANYGWHCWEGTLDYRTVWPSVAGDCDDDPGVYTFPIVELDGDEGYCSIIGGFVYRGTEIPGLRGHYLFGDWCKNELIRIYPGDGWIKHTMLNTRLFITSFGQDVHGEIYFGATNNPNIYKVIAP